MPHKTISHSLTTITNKLIAGLGSTLQLRPILIIASASADASADKSADKSAAKYSEMSAFLCF